MNQSKKITDGALLTAVYIVLLLITVFIPPIIMFGIFILPVPFIIYAARHGMKPALIMLFSTIVLSFVFATVISLPITLFAGIGGILIGGAIYRNLKPYEVWAQGTLGFIIGMVLVLLVLQFVANINIYEEMDVVIEDSIAMTKVIFDQLGLDSQAEKQVQLFEERMYVIKDLLPSSIAIGSIFFAFISQWISYKVINRVENKRLSFPPFKNFNLPVSLIWIYFIALILSFVDLGEGSGLYLIVMNVVALTIVLITIQGFSFIFFYADHKKVHKSIPIIIVVVTLLLPFLFLFLIRIIGIIDLGFSLKARLIDESKK
ncbi:YybS family protein [Pseudogracilibacillus sp. SO30301A]|uniref:YybS family protein n=1 Tax=Pseudogracilibacillus sp. SO30301A TaxID=3098291 RepID=UPI00300DF2E2